MTDGDIANYVPRGFNYIRGPGTAAPCVDWTVQTSLLLNHLGVFRSSIHRGACAAAFVCSSVREFFPAASFYLFNTLEMLRTANGFVLSRGSEYRTGRNPFRPNFL